MCYNSYFRVYMKVEVLIKINSSILILHFQLSKCCHVFFIFILFFSKMYFRANSKLVILFLHPAVYISKNITMPSLLLTKIIIPQYHLYQKAIKILLLFVSKILFLQFICSNQDPYKVSTSYLLVKSLVSVNLGLSSLPFSFSCYLLTCCSNWVSSSVLFIFHSFMHVLNIAYFLKYLRCYYIGKVKYGIHTAVGLLSMVR